VLTPDYDPIKKVAVARKNLATTIGLLELFRSIPKKAEELLDKLDDDRELKNIYKEIRRLIGLQCILSSVDFCPWFSLHIFIVYVGSVARQGVQQRSGVWRLGHEGDRARNLRGAAECRH
jgi:hypothetical protein